MEEAIQCPLFKGAFLFYLQDTTTANNCYTAKHNELIVQSRLAVHISTSI